MMRLKKYGARVGLAGIKAEACYLVEECVVLCGAVINFYCPVSLRINGESDQGLKSVHV